MYVCVCVCVCVFACMYVCVCVGMKLQSLKLPERSVFSDSAMSVVCEFPLTSLDLSDCLKITDRGISCLASMSTLSSLSLARTKLTDVGMPYLKG